MLRITDKIISNALWITGAAVALLSIQFGYFTLIPATLMIWSGILLRKNQQNRLKQIQPAENSCYSMEPRRFRKRSFGSIILAGFLASSCCTIPIIVILVIGAGSAALAVSFIQYTPEFLALGIIFMLAMLLYNIRKSNNGRLNITTIKRERHLILKSLLILGVVWIVITYGITPLVAAGVYNSALQTSEFDSTSPESNIVTENAKAVTSTIPPESKVKAPVTSEDSEREKNRPQTNDAESKLTPSNIRVVKLRIDGMYCSSCIYSEQVTLSSLRGVLKVNVWLGWLSPSGAEVVYDSSQITAEEIRKAATYYVFNATIESDTPTA